MAEDKTWSVREELAQKAEATRPGVYKIVPDWKFRVVLRDMRPDKWKVEERIMDDGSSGVITWASVYKSKADALEAVGVEIEARKAADRAQAERDRQRVYLDADGHEIPS